MLIGLDFDNTIVCYDRLFHRLAVERGLVTRYLPPSKQTVRDFLRVPGREDEWTELQGIPHCPRIPAAEPFPRVKEFLSQCRPLRVAVVAIALTLPVIAVGASIMTIDAPYTCCWGWALFLTYRAIFRGSGWAWPAAGILVGLGTLAK